VGDSVLVRGTIGSRNGQPTIDAGTATALGTGLFPTAAILTSQQAAAAAGGTRDAQMVVVKGAWISDTATVDGDFHLTVNDSTAPGSGDLTVVLDAAGGFVVPGTTVPGNRFDLIGLLVPTDTPGVWMLKPRSSADLKKR